MLCSNQQMILQALPCLGEEPPVLVDWLPWHHTFGGNHNIGIVVYNGGSLYLDEGRPMPGAFEEKRPEPARRRADDLPERAEGLRRTRARICARDPALRRVLRRVRVLFYAAAGLSQHVADELQRDRRRGLRRASRARDGLGATETAPMAICRPWASDLSSAIGVPVPGVEAKLAPSGRQAGSARQGPNVTPGYWRRSD